MCASALDQIYMFVFCVDGRFMIIHSLFLLVKSELILRLLSVSRKYEITTERITHANHWVIEEWWMKLDITFNARVFIDDILWQSNLWVCLLLSCSLTKYISLYKQSFRRQYFVVLFLEISIKVGPHQAYLHTTFIISPRLGFLFVMLFLSTMLQMLDRALYEFTVDLLTVFLI